MSGEKESHAQIKWTAKFLINMLIAGTLLGVTIYPLLLAIAIPGWMISIGLGVWYYCTDIDKKEA